MSARAGRRSWGTIVISGERTELSNIETIIKRMNVELTA